MAQLTALGLYRPGRSVLHRLGAGRKLLGLLILGGSSILLQTRWWLVSVALLLVAVGFLIAGLGLRAWWQQVRPMVWLLAFTAVLHLLVSDWRRAVCVVGMIVTLVTAAALITLTTPTTALIDVVVRLAGPLRRIGVDPERLGLTLLLGIRFVPVVAGLAREVRQAQYARGALYSYRAFAVPLLVRALRTANAIGDALVSRGLDD